MLYLGTNKKKARVRLLIPANIDDVNNSDIISMIKTLPVIRRFCNYQ